MPAPKFPDVEVSLPAGPSVYPCIAICVRRIRKAGHASQITGFIEDIVQFEDYDQAVRQISRWVSVI